MRAAACSTAKLSVPSALPRARIPCTVEDAVHHDLGRSDLIENRVRKPTKKGAPHRGIDKSRGLWLALDRGERGVDGGKKFGGAPRRLPVVPEVSFVHVKLSLRGEANPLHFRRRSLARICAQDFAAAGFRACARRRRASSLCCASVTGMASGVALRLSQISSSNSSRSATLSVLMSFGTVLMAGFSSSRCSSARPTSARITIALTSRGERMRASGLVERVVRQLIRGL